MTEIIEKVLGIPGDYQYKALRSKNYLQANWHSNKLIALETILKSTKAKNVLDLGTGSGNFELTFAKKLNIIVGVDYNDLALKFLAAKIKELKIKNVKLVSNDLRKINSIRLKQKFDLIICVDVIEHLDLKDSGILVKNIKKFLNPGGYVCIITPNYKSPWIIIEKFLDKFTIFPHLGGKQHLAKFYKENLDNLFTNAGCKTILSTTFNLFSFIFPNKKIATLLCKLEVNLKLPFGNLLVGIYRY